jgi:hypothetical protein
MAKGKHRITKKRAKELVDAMKQKKATSPPPFKDLPDGYIFEIEDVKTLISATNAAYFVIQLGWQEATTGPGGKKADMTPVLCVTDSQYNIIEAPDPLAGESLAATTDTETSVSRTFSTESSEDGDDGGGFLDESKPFPPPSIP